MYMCRCMCLCVYMCMCMCTVPYLNIEVLLYSQFDILGAADHARGSPTQLDEVLAHLGAIEHYLQCSMQLHEFTVYALQNSAVAR